MDSAMKIFSIAAIAVTIGLLSDLGVAAENCPGLEFLVVGDWGGLPDSPFTTAVQKAVANQMGIYASKDKADFVLALGDNFYFRGVRNVEDPRFKETYDSVYNLDPFRADWYLVGGNHDHYGNISAQIAYSKVEKRWNFPDLFYRLHFPIPSSASTIEILMIDTVVLCGNSDHDSLGLQPQGPENSLAAENQWIWLEKQLMNSKADYLLVAGHYPVFSIGGHGPTGSLVSRLMPLLHKYGVSAYLCGHDHDLQHLQYERYNATVEYFLSGAANFCDYDTRHKDSVPKGSSKFYYGDKKGMGGFGHVNVTPERMRFSFHSGTGHKLYEHDILPRRHH